MASYDYRCDKNHTLVVTYPIGTARRVISCPSCAGTMRLVIGAGVQIAPRQAAGAMNETELSRDLESYRRMRDRGIQPETVQGAARLENEVEDTFDVKYRDLYKLASKETIQDGVIAAQQYTMGIST